VLDDHCPQRGLIAAAQRSPPPDFCAAEVPIADQVAIGAE
jgi:hypothetical protein